MGEYSGGEYRVPAGLLSCGRGGLLLRAYGASLQQDGKKVMLTTTRTWEGIRAVSIEFRLVCSAAVGFDPVLGGIRPHSGRTEEGDAHDYANMGEYSDGEYRDPAGFAQLR
jgi:hypothetical protein